MSVIGDKYDNFQRGEGIYHSIVRPKLAKLQAFDDIEEGDYVLLIDNIPNTNYVFDTYYKIQKILPNSSLLIFYNGVNIKIKYRRTNMYEYQLINSLLSHKCDLKIVKFEDELEHYQMLQQKSEEIDT